MFRVNITYGQYGGMPLEQNLIPVQLETELPRELLRSGLETFARQFVNAARKFVEMYRIYVPVYTGKMKDATEIWFPPTENEFLDLVSTQANPIIFRLVVNVPYAMLVEAGHGGPWPARAYPCVRISWKYSFYDLLDLRLPTSFLTIYWTVIGIKDGSYAGWRGTNKLDYTPVLQQEGA